VNQPSSPQLELAQRHDAAGNHDEAINALARGTGAGDLACMRELGKRLLTGDRAPLLAVEGVRFIGEAATKGDAEAAARVASLTAMGLYRPQNWREAQQWLGVAADRGWQPAREQLIALAAASSAAGSGAAPNPAGANWRQLAADLDLSSWSASPPTRVLSTDPQVHVVDDFIPPAACDWIIAHARGRLTRARVYDAVNAQDIVSNTRTNSVANSTLASVEMLDLLLQAKMSAACRQPMRNMEAPAVLHYAVGEANIDHYDFVDPGTPDYAQEIARNGQRVVTFLVYLNDEYQGGETAFPRLGFSHKGQRGQGLFFVNALPDMQPDLRMLHSGRPPTSGEKWIVSQFIRSRAMIAQ
jgi:prolyl 4-hydroxylase